MSACGDNALRAFDKTVRRKPLAGCGGRGVLWDLNRFRLGSHCNKRSCAKTPLLMLIDILLLASSEVILAPEGQSVKTTDTCRPQTLAAYTRGSVRRASGFVLTGHPEINFPITDHPPGMRTHRTETAKRTQCREESQGTKLSASFGSRLPE